jgi:uncharacterized protein (TIGR02118 family)
MAGAKIVVLYPPPKDVASFERAYVEEHVPIARDKIVGNPRFVFSKVVGAPGGAAPAFHRIAEIYFPSLQKLQESLATKSTQEAAGHAVSISNGGPPVFLIVEEDTSGS